MKLCYCFSTKVRNILPNQQNAMDIFPVIPFQKAKKIMQRMVLTMYFFLHFCGKSCKFATKTTIVIPLFYAASASSTPHQPCPIHGNGAANGRAFRRRMAFRLWPRHGCPQRFPLRNGILQLPDQGRFHPQFRSVQSEVRR